MGFWKVVGWILLIWFLLATGFIFFVAFWWGIKIAMRDERLVDGTYTDDDLVAAGYLGYQIGRNS